MTSLETTLSEAVSALERVRVDYALIGGLAVAAWGEPRATLDVDITVEVEPKRTRDVIEDLCREFRPLTMEPVPFVERTRVLPLQHATGSRIDLIFASTPFERDSIARAQPKAIAGKQVRLASVEDLVLMKIFSLRQRDMDDARRLLRRFRDRLDREYLEPRLCEMAAALAQSEILDVYRRETGHPV